MKTYFKNLNTTLLLSLLLLISSNLYAQDSKRGKNILELGFGLALPNFTSTPDGQAYADSGSNISFSYEREIVSRKKEWLTIGVRYLTLSNPYNTSADVLHYSVNYPQYTFSETSGNYKLSSFLIGCGFYDYLGKKQKFTVFAKAYLGTGSLTTPAQDVKANNVTFENINEATKNSFVYTGSVGINYNFSKMVSLGVNMEYVKGSFLYTDQKYTYVNVNNTYTLPSYTISYSNICLNTALSFRF